MKHYEGNSIKSREGAPKEEKKTVEKVVKGVAKTRKQSEFKKIAGAMITDEVKSIKDHTIYQIIIPTIVDTISQIVKDAIDLTFRGEVGASSRSSSRVVGGSSRNVSRVSYNSLYDDRRDNRRVSDRYSYDEVTFETRDDAEKVLSCMEDVIDSYGVVTVADFFEFAGITGGNGYTDRNYGWSNLRSAKIERLSANEWLIVTPRASVIR